jgi:hypothetical protein
MRIHPVNSCNINAVLFNAAPGDVFELQSGEYKEPIVVRNIHGREDAPIILRGTEGAVIDGGLSFNDFEPRASIEAWRVNSYPGLYHIAHEAWIHIESCSWVIIEGLRIMQCWPTAAYFHNSQHLTFRNLDIKDATFAIYGEGDDSNQILIEDCQWLQDITEKTLWKELTWEAIHGTNPKINGGRAFDGAFFRTRNIKGDVVIRNNRVRHAANGIHMFNRTEGKTNRNQLNHNVQIYGNRFENIRDNAIEPERLAINWWIFDNEFADCHALFSLDMDTCGFFYVYGNRCWFTMKPGPPGDSHSGGKVFKLDKKPWLAVGPTYVFNNSMYIRTKYMTKCSMRQFNHFNNAICCCHALPAGLDEACDSKRSFLKKVTTDWEDLEIRFRNDMVFHPAFPDKLIKKGYSIENGLGKNPKFSNPSGGDLSLSDTSPAIQACCEYRIDLPWGASWALKAKGDIGAFQNGEVIQGPTFRSY